MCALESDCEREAGRRFHHLVICESVELPDQQLGHSFVTDCGLF